MTDSFDSGSRPANASGAGDSPAGDSVLAGLGEVTWSEEDGISYEVALDNVNEVVGAYSGLISREEGSPNPDTTTIEDWRRMMLTWARKRRDLSPDDPEALRAVRREAADVLRSLSHRE